MYFIPIAIWISHPQITVSFYIWKSLIPTTLENIIGGGVFVGAAYCYLYLTGIGDVEIDFNLGSLHTAMMAGGPMGPANARSQFMPHGHHGGQGEVLESKELNGSDGNGDPPDLLPHSGSYMASGIGKELVPDIYGKSTAERQTMDEEKNTGS